MTTVEDAHALVEAPEKGVKILERPQSTTGWFSWVTTVDHKKIAIMYGSLAIFFFVLGGIEALFIRLQLAAPDGTVLTASRYNEFFTMHGTTMVFLFGMPIAAAFGNYFVPLMIGARDVAFPRINMLGFWIFAFGGIFIYSSFLFGGAPNAGWFGYAPLSSTPMSYGYLPGRGPDFWSVGLIMLGIGSVATAVNFLVTTLNMRAPGMTMMRMPVFVWMILVIAFLTLFAMPPVTAALIMVFMDRNFHTNFFNAAAGGDPLMYQNLFWIFGHPEVYILILPGMGIVSEILPVFSRKPLFGYAVIVFSGIAIGFLGWGVWAHHMFVSGIGPVAVSAFGLSTMLIAIPTGVKIFNWLGTVWGGAVRLATPMLFALAFIAQFTLGGLSGVMHAIVPSDTQQTDTYFVVAHFHYVLFGGLAFALFGGFYYWWPKMFGKMLNETIGKVNFWLMVIGFNLTFFPMHFLGFVGQPRRTYTYPDGMGWESLNLLATIGAFIIALGVLVFLVNVVYSARRSGPAPADPWDARTLEWMTSSPPPEYNFGHDPVITHRDELWHRKYTEDENGVLVRLPAGAGGEVDLSAKDDPNFDPHSIHMPSPSYWPLIFAFGLPILGYGFVFKNWWILAAGVLIMFYGISGWAIEPATDPKGPYGGHGHDAPHDDAPGGEPVAAATERALMSQAVVPAPDAYHLAQAEAGHGADTNTGVSNAKLAIWLFLSSEALFFGAFISTYFLYRGRDAEFKGGITPDDVFDIPFTSVTSFILLMSSLTMVLALAAIQRGDHRRLRIWLLATCLFGLTFIGGQVFEFTHMYREGLSLSSNMFGTTFFVLTGLHGAHVTMGIIWLLVLYGRSMQQRLPSQNSEAVEIAGLYWHFVDIVWIFIFTAIYLIPSS